MVAVAIVAVSLAAARAESAPIAGITIVGSCVCYLAYKRYSEVVALRVARGLMTNGPQKVTLLLSSVIVAAVIIGLSDVAFLAGYYGYLRVADKTVRMSHWTPYHDPGYMSTGVIIGVILALCVASSLRHTIWPLERAESRHPRRWIKLWPVVVAALIALALGADEMRERREFCAMMVDYHADRERAASDAKSASLHAGLKRWYRYTMWRPWLPVHPERGRAGASPPPGTRSR
jgi:hypothetical protein